MSVVLRHKRFPLVIIYKDPKKSWDKIVEEHILEEIKKDGFDKFTVIDWARAKALLEFGIKNVPEPKKKKKAKKKKKKK